jgi:hypothetical protein
VSRKLIDDAAGTYDPATLKLLGQAFDQAWVKIADRYSEPSLIQAKRHELAQAILDLASVGERNIDVLVTGAVMAIDQGEKPTALTR